ncbi:hypothetical protein RIF29_28955 [Crotalaria pallida]|uniref:Uncharacterized protein n=1 Tax=Crotalaria pallida TaxID=3830 RepID=A0AAN9EDM3_CROPI
MVTVIAMIQVILYAIFRKSGRQQNQRLHHHYSDIVIFGYRCRDYYNKGDGSIITAPTLLSLDTDVMTATIKEMAATEFSISLHQTMVVEEPIVIPELHNLVDALTKVCSFSNKCIHSLLHFFREHLL